MQRLLWLLLTIGWCYCYSNQLRFDLKKRKHDIKILLAVFPKKSLSSSMVFEITGGETGGGGGDRELVAPAPHGSDTFIERPVLFVAVVC